MTMSRQRSTRIARTLCASLTLLAPLAVSAAAPDPVAGRIALVIGNGAYAAAPLVNPAADARAIAERLREAGFRVTLKTDAPRRELQDAIRGFGDALARDNQAVGVFYYAGHGVQLNWRNFMLPVDARIRRPADIAAQGVDVGLLLDSLGRARNPLNLVILDACRDNPFGRDFRTDDRGLSQLDAPPGTLLAYATAPGNTADDGEGAHGLYTENLLKEMKVPGAPVEDVFKRVRLAVRRASEGAQIPWESTSLEGDFAFVGGSGRDPSREQKEFEADLATWNMLREATTPEPLEDFIRQRPSGKFAELAQYRLDLVLRKRGEKPVHAAPPPPLGPEMCVPIAADGKASPYSGQTASFRPGERYTYRTVDLLAQTETARSTDTVLRIVGDEVLYNDGSKVSDLFGNNVRAPDGKRWTPYQFFINDYALGKRWPTQFIITQPDGTTVGVRFEVRVAGRERITLPAGTFDSYRIEARGFDLASGAQLERTAWVAPERLRGVLAMESLSRKGGTVVSGERVELTDYAAGVPPVIPAAKPSAPAEEKQDGRRWPFSY
ncbi:Peptidase C14 caspase catalytic subunit p20 [Candidatus Accumulibacter aalborgensis]|uniref:Peptidase C14 caspase catalytic subunit p20 n=2 Tax=Candidatus Accumulibacter aalborgensis TaxID=1860102 RepID=A0A1A8XEL9_9PROT|nr:Peptidase C14 caspase catalytic subunit p20 [Candidatus Accumulibacter aalborgensis]